MFKLKTQDDAFSWTVSYFYGISINLKGIAPNQCEAFRIEFEFDCIFRLFKSQFHNMKYFWYQILPAQFLLFRLQKERIIIIMIIIIVSKNFIW